MTNKEVVKAVYEYLEPIAIEYDVLIDDVELVKEGPNHYLRVYIDKETEGGVFIQDCVNVSRALEVILDEEDPISVPYTLEVSSPGADKVLKKESDFEKYKGRLVDVKLYKQIDKQKEFTGELVSLENDILKILVEEEELEFEYPLVSQVRLTVVF